MDSKDLSKKEDKDIIEPSKKKKKKSTIKYILNISFVLIVSFLAIYLALKDNFNEIVGYIFKSDYRFLLAIFGILALFVLVRSLILFVFARLFTRDYKYTEAIAVHFIGVFYGAVTPGGQGGEVMQAYTYKKQGLQISSAVSALAMHSILYQIILIIYGSISLIVKYSFIETLPAATLGKFGDVTISLPMWILTILGFALNVGYIGIILGMCYWKSLHNFVMGPIIGLLNKMHIIKDPDKSRESFRLQLENFKIESRRLFSNVPFTILVSVLLFISMTLNFSIPYFIGLAMGNQSSVASFWDSVFLSNYHQMATGLIPIPGSAGVSEFVFRSLFSSYPATASQSFYYLQASEEAYAAFFDKLIAHPVDYASDFNGLKQYIEAWKNSNQEVFVEYILKLKGTTYAELGDENVIQFVHMVCDYQESSSLASASMVMWRSITFIIPLFFSGIVTAFYRASPKDEQVNQNNIPGRRTLVALREETYVERVKMAETMIETSRLTRESIARKLRSLAKNDKRKKKKKNNKNDNTSNKYRDVNIENEDDSI